MADSSKLAGMDSLGGLDIFYDPIFVRDLGGRYVSAQSHRCSSSRPGNENCDRWSFSVLAKSNVRHPACHIHWRYVCLSAAVGSSPAPSSIPFAAVRSNNSRGKVSRIQLWRGIYQL